MNQKDKKKNNRSLNMPTIQYPNLQYIGVDEYIPMKPPVAKKEKYIQYKPIQRHIAHYSNPEAEVKASPLQDQKQLLQNKLAQTQFKLKQLQKFQQERDKLINEKQFYSKLFEETNRRNEELDDQLLKKNNQINQLTSQADKWKKRYSDILRNNKKKQQVEVDCQSLDKVLKMEQKIQRFQQKIQKSEAKINQLETQKKDLSNKLKQIDSETLRLKNENSKLQKQQQFKDRKVKQYESRVILLSQQIQRLNLVIRQKIQQLSLKQKKVQQYKNKMQNSQQYNNKLNAQLKALQVQIKKQELSSVPSQTHKKMVTLLKSQIQKYKQKLEQEIKQAEDLRQQLNLLNKQDMENLGLCKYCLYRKANVVNIECGHISVCDQCVQLEVCKQKCMMCKAQGPYKVVFNSLLRDN